MNQAEDRRVSGPLRGVRVLEMGVFHAGPGATAILGDLGAEVIKIEPLDGDPERYWTTVGDLDFSLPNGGNVMFHASNRNKRGICLEMGRPEAAEVFHRLVRWADVFLTNLRPGTKEKLGLDYPTLYEVNPRLIHASVSGYGPRGPMRDLGAFDPLGMARSGLLFVTGSEHPAFLHIGILDQATAITASHAVLAALFARERTGTGQEVHVSLYSAGLWLTYPNLMVNNILSMDPTRTGDRNRHSPLRNFFRCRDGGWIMATHHPEERYWADFCEATGQRQLMEDPRFSTQEARTANCADLVAHFDEVFASRDRDEWMAIFVHKGLMFSPIQHVDEIQKDPQALANDYIVDFEDPELGPVKIPGYPAHFSGGGGGTRSLGPRLGEHTGEVMGELGYSDEQIEALRRKGAIR